MKEKIVTTYNPSGMRGGKQGCFEAKLESSPGIWEAGITRRAAIENLMATLKTLGKSDSVGDYEVIER